MVYSHVCRVVLVLFSLLIVLAHTETVFDPALSSRDLQDAMSGDPPIDVTTRNPLLDRPGKTVTYGYEDTTHPTILEDDEGVLGPGAITAIVIAVFLGASVLLSLIVITIKKFTTS